VKFAVFYMKGGHVLTVRGVKEVTMTRDTVTGSYSGYNIKWEEGHAPSLFTMSIPDIVAVEVHEAREFSFLDWFRG
jgi:hypothetical protein